MWYTSIPHEEHILALLDYYHVAGYVIYFYTRQEEHILALLDYYHVAGYVIYFYTRPEEQIKHI